MKNDRQTKNELIEELESVRREAKKLERLLEKRKHIEPDITQRKRLQEELGAPEELYRSTFETSQDGLLLVHRSKGDILDSNVYAQELFGYSKDEFLKNNLWGVGVVKDDKDFQEALSRLERDGVIYYDNILVKNKAGLLVNTEIILVDKVKFIQCNIRDNTARKRAEEQHRQSEGLFRLITENATDLIAVLDLEGKRIYSSPSYKSILGDPESLRATDSFQEIHPEDREKMRRIFLETVKTGIGQRAEYRFLLKDGSVRYIESQGSVIRDENGNTIKVMVVSRDVTERKQAEKQIVLLAHTLKSVAECVSITDRNDIVLFVNNAFLNTYGYTEQEILGKNINIVRSPNTHPGATRGILAATLAGGWSGELMNRTKDGRDFPVSLSTSFVRDEQGQDIALVGIATDITDRLSVEQAGKQAEEELKKSEGKFRAIFDNASDGMFLVDLNAQKFFLCNAMCVKMLGYTQEELLTLDIDEIHPSEDLPFINEQIGKFSRGEEGFRSDIRFKRKDGSIFAADLRPVLLIIAEKKYLLINFTDITERKRSEQAVRDNEKRFRAIFDQAPIALALLDMQGCPIISNLTLSKMVGYSNDELSKMKFTDFTFPEDADKDLKQFTALLEGKISKYSMEKRYVHKNGNLVWANLFVTMLRDENGIPQEIIRMAVDITERKLAEEGLKKSEEKYRSIFENVQDVYYESAIDGTILEVSPSIEIVSKGQYRRNDLIGKPMNDFYFNSEERQVILSTLQEQGSVTDFEVMIKNRDGSQIPCSISAKIHFDAQGHPEKIIGSMRDISKRKWAEDALKISEEMLKSVFASTPDSITVTDLNGRITLANQAAADIRDISSAEQLVGKSFYDLVAEEERHRAEESMKKVMALGVVKDIEFIGLKGNNERFIGELSISVLKDSAGRTSGFVGIAKDITKRKHAEEALRNEKILLRTVIDNIPDVIYAKDINSRKTLANLAEVHNLRVKSDAEVLGKDDFEFYPKEIAEGFFADDQSVIQTGQPVLNREEYILDEKGQQRWLLTSKVPLRNEKKQIVGLIGIGHDLTESKLAEEALQESELRFRSLYENATIGIYRTTPDGKILLANPALVKMLGYTSFENLAKLNLEKDGLKSFSQRKEFLVKIERDGEVTGYESKWICQDGTYIIVLESARAIRDSDGETLYYDGTVENITEHKSLQGQLLQTQKVQSIGTLAGGIAHDFNNILGIILAYTSILERSGADEEKISKSTKSITQAVSRGAALVRQILTFARQTGALVKPILIPDLIRELVIMLQETFPEVIEFQTTIEKNIPFVNADQTQMHQVLLNLCVNARDAMPKGGIIGIEVKTVTSETLIRQFPEAESDRYVSIRVSDTGTGMDDATKSRIFDPFFTTKEQGKGTGLGLSVVYGVIQEHHGFISVESNVGQGTTFHLYIPVAQEDKKIQDVQKIRTAGTQGGSETILFVEDEELLREVVQSTLESNGYKVLIATNGRDAVEIYKRQYKDIALVLSDMGLPKLTGIDVYAMLKEINPDVKIVFASGFLSLETRSELLKEGAKGFIQKPYNINEVLDMVREVLDEKGEK